jgi:dTDP-D-glucose 4,6-dehydratase
LLLDHRTYAKCKRQYLNGSAPSQVGYVTSMLYLITGAADFLGINLVRYLLKRGPEVRSLDIAPFDYPEKSKVDVIQGDIRDHQAVSQAISGTNVVVHCGAALPLYSRDEIFSTEVEGTRVLLESLMMCWCIRCNVRSFAHRRLLCSNPCWCP